MLLLFTPPELFEQLTIFVLLTFVLEKQDILEFQRYFTALILRSFNFQWNILLLKITLSAAPTVLERFTGRREIIWINLKFWNSYNQWIKDSALTRMTFNSLLKPAYPTN